MSDKEPRRFIISERKNGLGLHAMNHGVTYTPSNERNYYNVIEYFAYTNIQKEIEKRNKLIGKLKEALEQGTEGGGVFWRLVALDLKLEDM